MQQVEYAPSRGPSWDQLPRGFVGEGRSPDKAHSLRRGSLCAMLGGRPHSRLNARANAAFESHFRLCEGCVKVLCEGLCEGFRTPAATNVSTPPRPASENLQGTKPREGARIWRCGGLSYGDLAVDGPQLRCEARWGEWWRWPWRSDASRFCDPWGGV